MTYTATITQKGQVTIPIEIRNLLGVKPHQKIDFIKKGSEIVIKKSTADFYSLEGSLKSNIKYSDRLADKAIADAIAKDYAQENSSS